TPVNTMQSTGSDAAIDGTLREAERDELPTRNDAVLSLRQSRDRPITHWRLTSTLTTPGVANVDVSGHRASVAPMERQDVRRTHRFTTSIGRIPSHHECLAISGL